MSGRGCNIIAGMAEQAGTAGRERRWLRIAAVAAVLAAHVLLAWTSSRQKSATMDEPFHVAAGIAALKSGDFRLAVDSPPLIDMWCALPLLLVPDLQVPFDLPSWRNPKADVSFRKQKFAEYLFWKRDVGPWRGNADPARLIALARLPVLVLSALLGLLLYAWGNRLGGPAAGLAALVLYCFDPNVIAHAGLATVDVGCALTVVLAAFALWRHLERPSWARLALAGLALGLALLAKHTGIFLLALWPVAMLWSAPGSWGARLKRMVRLRGEDGTELRGLAGYGLMVAVALATVWAGYGFEVRSVHDPATLLLIDVGADRALWLRRGLIRVLSAVPLPPRTYYYGVGAAVLNRAAAHYPLYFLGRVSEQSSWYYYPLVLAMKAPLVQLGLIAAALGLWIRRRLAPIPAMAAPIPAIAARVMAVTGLGLPLIFMVFNARTIGLRHLLPALPMLHLGLARMFNTPFKARWPRWALGLALAAYAVNAGLSWPDYLVHFNSMVGGPDGGLRYSVVGEDWGQDQLALGRYCADNRIERIHYDPYGHVDPRAYGVPYVRFTCADLEPGWYAVNIVDLLRPRRPELAPCLTEFLNQTPVTVLDHTIYVYRR
jgi:hypothetical protein